MDGFMELIRHEVMKEFSDRHFWDAATSVGGGHRVSPVKELLNKKKLETLVDSKLQGYYIVEEVEELIQVALLCTLNTASDRPKMSDVVKMIEGDGLAERWEQWKKEDIICGELNHCNFSSNNWIINDSTPGLHPEELSGPR